MVEMDAADARFFWYLQVNNFVNMKEYSDICLGMMYEIHYLLIVVTLDADLETDILFLS